LDAYRTRRDGDALNHNHNHNIQETVVYIHNIVSRADGPSRNALLAEGT
jgi:hypothetical protein